MSTLVKYNTGHKNELNGVAPIDWDTDSIKVMLASSSYTPNAATHDFKNDITNEISGGGYVADGVVISGMSVSESGGTITVYAGNVSFAQNASGFTNARYAIIYKNTGIASTSPLIGYINFGADRGNVNGDLNIQFTGGVLFTEV